MSNLRFSARTRRRALLVLNLSVRAAIIFWLAEAWILQDDPRFVDKAIPERNTLIVGMLSLLFPAIWASRRLDWLRYPLGLDIVYLSIYALDMAGNSFNLYDSRTYFDLVPHFHSTGAFSLIVAVYWARSRHPAAPHLPDRRWLLETTLVAAGIATMVHVTLEMQEYYTDVLAGTVNVGGVADTVNDLAVGLMGALVYPPLAARWFIGDRRLGWLRAATLVVLVLLAAVALADPGPRLADAIADRFATASPRPLPEETRARLLDLAVVRAAAPPSVNGIEVRHAHDATTIDELSGALTGGYHSIEGDVGLYRATPLMRHDPRDAVELTFADWLEVVGVADFPTVKIDVKRDRLAPIIADISRATTEFGLDECRLKLNADVLEGPGAYGGFSLNERLYTRIALKLEPDDLVRLASAFPCATMSIGAWTGPVDDGVTYGERDVADILSVADELRAAGTEHIVVAARWDLLTDAFVDAMSRAGIVADVWNSTTVRSPEDLDAEMARLRTRYGDALGVIDLRN